VDIIQERENWISQEENSGGQRGRRQGGNDFEPRLDKARADGEDIYF